VNGYYYFCPYDIDPSLPVEGGDLAGMTVINALAGLPGTRLLILDTCRAASITHGAGT
jgi:hypothetical protein